MQDESLRVASFWVDLLRNINIFLNRIILTCNQDNTKTLFTDKPYKYSEYIVHLKFDVNKKLVNIKENFFAFACNAKSFAIAINFFFFFFSTVNLDGRTKVVSLEFLTFVKLDECGLIRAHWKALGKKYLSQSKISCLKT